MRSWSADPSCRITPAAARSPTAPVHLAPADSRRDLTFSKVLHASCRPPRNSPASSPDPNSWHTMQGGQSGVGGGERTGPVGYRSRMPIERDAVRRERLRKNEQVFRDYNNRRVAFEQDADTTGELVPFVCECG